MNKTILKRATHFYYLNGVEDAITNISKKLSIPRTTLQSRVNGAFSYTEVINGNIFKAIRINK